MKFRNTIILALVVAAFGAYLYFIERPAAEKEAKKQTVVEFDRDKVAELQLKYPDREISLKKVDGQWRLTAPIATEADETTVKNLIASIADAERKKVIDEKPAELANFGLDKPTVTVTVKLEGGATVPAIEVGKTTPVGYSAYVKLDDGPAVLLTTAAFQSGVKKEVKDLRDKTILDVKDEEVQQVTIRGGADHEIVLKKEGGDWSLAKPMSAKADAAQVRSYLSSLRSMRAQDFIDEAGSPDKTYGLTDPRLAIELLVGQDRAEKKLLVGGALGDAAKKQIYVKRGERDTIYTVGDYLFTSLNKTAADFRDKTVLVFDKDKLESVQVTRADGKSFKLEKKDGKWTLADPGDAKIKEIMPGRFVDDVKDLKGAEIASETAGPEEFGLGKPAITINLVGADGQAIGAIRATNVGADKQKKLYATAVGSKTVYTLRDYVFERIDKQRDDFNEAPPAPAAGSSPGIAPPGAAAQGDEAHVPLPPLPDDEGEDLGDLEEDEPE